MLSILVAVLALLIYFYMLYRQPAYLDGVWVADKKFVQSQQLSVCRFYIIGDKATIVMADAVGTIYDDVFDIQHRRRYRSWLSPFTGRMHYTVNIPDTMFANMSATLNTETGQLVLANTDICIALYKNNEESANYFKQLAA